MSTKAKIWNFGTIPFRYLFRFDKAKAKSCIQRMKGAVSNSEQKTLLRKMRIAESVYRWSYSEFFYFHYLELSRPQRRSIAVDYVKNMFTLKVNDQKISNEYFLNKWNAFRKFQPFFKREVALIEGDSAISVLSDMLCKYHKVILKPIDGNSGRGVRIIDESEVEQLSSILVPGSQYIAEEMICQSEEFSVFHPQSVNTLRIITFNVGDRVDILCPIFRMGQGDSIVDNAGSGGVFAAIDVKTGKTIGAADKKGHYFQNHPDTNLPLVGIQIPYWNELMAVSKELALVIPQVAYSGWDFAHSEKGWQLVEANCWPQLGWQVASRIGVHETLDQLEKEFLKKHPRANM